MTTVIDNPLSSTTTSIMQQLKLRYANAQATNHIPSLLELTALSVQMVSNQQTLTGEQKLQVVKTVVAGIVAQLPLPPLMMAELQAGLFVVGDLAEVALSLLRVNERLLGEAQTEIQGCLPVWCGGRKPVVPTPPVKIPFPVISVAISKPVR